MVDGRPVLLLSSNNYLGLADHPALRGRAPCEAIRRWGCGTGASRLISGHLDLHAEVEAQLAALQGHRGGAPLPLGLPGQRRRDHRARRSRRPRLQRRAQPREHHRRLPAVARLRPRLSPPRRPGARGASWPRPRQGGRRLIVTDSVFSMDGDRAPLRDLVALARAYHTSVFLDEAHATGVLGPRGAGLAEADGLGAEVDGAHGHARQGARRRRRIRRRIARARRPGGEPRAQLRLHDRASRPRAVAAAGAALASGRAPSPSAARDCCANAARLRAGSPRSGLRAEGDTHIIPVMLGDNAPRDALRRRAARARRARARDPPADRSAGHRAPPRDADGDAHRRAASTGRSRVRRRSRARSASRHDRPPRRWSTWDHRHLWHPFTQMPDWLGEEPLVIAAAEGN